MDSRSKVVPDAYLVHPHCPRVGECLTSCAMNYTTKCSMVRQFLNGCIHARQAGMKMCGGSLDSSNAVAASATAHVIHIFVRIVDLDKLWAEKRNRKLSSV